MTDIALIVAVAQNGVIGRDNDLPWHIPEDLKWFKENTMGKPMIMGRKTYESLGRPLPGRQHIVVSKTAQIEHEQVHVVPSLERGIELGTEIARDTGADEVMVIGGGTIYAQVLPKVKRIYRTLVELTPDGDTFFPELSDAWTLKYEKKGQTPAVNFFFQVVEKTL